MNIITRLGKGSPLTNSEMDSNLLSLRDSTASKVGVVDTIFWTDGVYPPNSIVLYQGSTYINENETSDIPGLSDEWIALSSTSKSSLLTFASDTLTVTNGVIKPKHKPRDDISWGWLLLTTPPQPLVPSLYTSPNFYIGPEYNGQQVKIFYAHVDQPIIMAERSVKFTIFTFDFEKHLHEMITAIDTITFDLNKSLINTVVSSDHIYKDITTSHFSTFESLDAFYKLRDRNKFPNEITQLADSISTSVAKVGGIRDYGSITESSIIFVDFQLITDTPTQFRDYGATYDSYTS
jgi:hypothetical protein